MLEKNAPRWQNELTKKILYVLCFRRWLQVNIYFFQSSQHNEFLDEANQGKDIASLDFAALDKLADDWEGEPMD